MDARYPPPPCVLPSRSRPERSAGLLPEPLRRRCWCSAAMSIATCAGAKKDRFRFQVSGFRFRGWLRHRHTALSRPERRALERFPSDGAGPMEER